MLGMLKMCYTCLVEEEELINVSSLDYDGTTFLYKLQMCVSSVLEEDNSRLMCSACIKQLRECYKFRETVLLSQEVLHKRKNEQLSVVFDEEKCKMLFKVEVDREFFNPECLIVNNNSVELSDATHKSIQNLEVLTHNTNDDTYGYLIEKTEVPDESNNTPCTIDDILNGFRCALCNVTLKSLNVQHVCTGYTNNYKETKDGTKLKVMRRRVKKKINTQEESEFECYHCGIVFNKRWKLQKHITRLHTNTKKHVCSYCHKSFKQSYHLREHLTSHTGERNYTCSYCGKAFQRVSSMKRHIRSHERAPGEKTKKTPFLCTVCGKNFPFSNGVQRHMRMHLGIRNHECTVCQRRFTQSTHLHVHMRTHTGEKPYICDTCGEAFSLNASLQKHMVLHVRENENIVKLNSDSN